jgi:hypothetical protein
LYGWFKGSQLEEEYTSTRTEALTP